MVSCLEDVGGFRQARIALYPCPRSAVPPACDLRTNCPAPSNNEENLHE